MTPYQLFSLKNRMLFYNMLMTIVGTVLILILSFKSISPPFYVIQEFAHRINNVFIPIFYGIIIIAQLVYEKPIRQYLNALHSEGDENHALQSIARRRLLNAPFFIIALDFMIWLSVAGTYAILYYYYTDINLATHRVFFQNLLVGLISTTAAFFLMGQILQKSLVVHFFPEGGLSATPRTARIRIRTRFTAFLMAINVIPFFALLLIIHGTFEANLPSHFLLDHVRTSVIVISLISLSVGMCLTILMSLNFSRPMDNIIHALKRIKNGHLDGMVDVTTNDEMGYTGDVINEMTAGLRERERMKHSLALAKEIQSRLLPETAPQVDGLDMAGTSQYCDETGGDYFDFLPMKDSESAEVAVVLGDVSDHGVHSALLMTTARAFIRLRSALPGSLAQIVADVNYHFSTDTEAGGQFMTLFYLMIDLETASITWVRAGHDPALLYDPATDSLEELGGKGAPLGIRKELSYQEYERKGLAKGQVIVLSTDGVWEARNPQGEFFGKDRLSELIRNNARLSASDILDTIMEAVHRFQDSAKTEDDITLAVIKVTKSLTSEGSALD